MPDLNRIIVIGASTGGIDALQIVARDLPRDLPAAIFVVVHLAPTSPNMLDRILSRAGPLPATLARDGEKIETGHIYIAPADHHLLIAPASRMRTSRGPKENRMRPAIDPLFRSAAAVYGPRVIGIILTGDLDDGTSGLWAVRARGGVTIVQNPEEALVASMPLNALKQVEVNHCVALERIAPLVVRLANRPPPAVAVPPVDQATKAEIAIANDANALESGVTDLGDPSLFTCPECHGVLLRMKAGAPLRFRCHTGHAFSLESLLAAVSEKTEDALWNALRAFDEGALLLRQTAEHLEQHRHVAEAKAVRQRARDAERQSRVVRALLGDPKRSWAE